MKKEDIRPGLTYLVEHHGKVKARVIRPGKRMGFVCDVAGENVVLDEGDFLYPFRMPVRTLVEDVKRSPANKVRMGLPPRDEAEAEKMERYQERRSGGGNLVITARAGTGKTFTLVEGLKRIFGRRTPGIEGSEQQEAIWKEMKRGGRPGSAAFVAFNRSIAAELKKKVPQGCTAMTMHGLGMQACCRTYNLTTDDLMEKRTEKHIGELEDCDIRELRKVNAPYVNALTKMVRMCKLTLSPTDEQSLGMLAARYEIEIPDVDYERVLENTPKLLERARTQVECLDFEDMIWLPVVNKLQVQKFELLLIDEGQDLGSCQQQLAMKAGKRVILVGDPRQAIYGFAGADTDSIPRMTEMLKANVLPLTMTRRCGKKIVELAQTLVPDFEAFDGNAEGAIYRDIPQEQSLEEMTDGDMALCRVNAPLVSTVFKLLRQKRKANIAGRNIGDALWLFIKEQVRGADVKDMLVRLDDYQAREIDKLNNAKFPSEGLRIALNDRCECVRAFADGSAALGEIKEKINDIFLDESRGGILLSSVHRAKGLEAKRVWVLEPALMPHPMARSEWQREQEENLQYVAWTRAIAELRFVCSTPKSKGMKNAKE